MDEKRYLRLGVNVDHVATVRNARGIAHQTQSAALLAAGQGRTVLPRIFARTAVISSTTISSV